MDKLRAQSSASARMLAELQSANAQLRAASQQRSASQSGAPAASAPSAGSQLAGLEALLERREKEVTELRQALAGSSAQLQRLALQGDGEGINEDFIDYLEPQL